MKKVWSLGVFTVATLLVASLLFGLAPVVAAQGKGPPERFLVFTDGDPATNDNVHKKAKEKAGQVLTTVHIQKGLDLLLTEVPGEAKGDLAGVKGVKEVSPEISGELLDGATQLQWGVSRVDADCVWGLTAANPGDPDTSITCQQGIGAPIPRHAHLATGTLTGAGVRIAIVDTGIDLTHEDLMANLAASGHADCVDTGNSTCVVDSTVELLKADDTYGHGTHVAGIAAAVANGIGVIGVAPGATLLAVQVCNPSTCPFTSLLNGIRYVANPGTICGLSGTEQCLRRADVMNISLGWPKTLQKQCPSCVTALQTVIDEAWNQGVVIVAAAGNSGNSGGSGDNITYPGRSNNVVAVGCTMSNDVRCSFSSTGPALDLAAPGYGIYSTLPPNSAYGNSSVLYGTLSGTSMSSPHTVGAAALKIQAMGTAYIAATGPATVRDSLTSTADDLGAAGFDTKYGWGLLDAKEAATGTP